MLNQLKVIQNDIYVYTITRLRSSTRLLRLTLLMTTLKKTRSRTKRWKILAASRWNMGSLIAEETPKK